MKRLILVCGANGIGKSTACKNLVEIFPSSAYIDSDYCRYMSPFSFSKEEMAVVVSNISNMMINYFKLSTINNVIFQYGFHGVRRQIFNDILFLLNESNIKYEFCPIILECSLEENIRRMQNDCRDLERINRAIANTISIYDELCYPRIDTTKLSPEETAIKMKKTIEDYDFGMETFLI